MTSRTTSVEIGLNAAIVAVTGGTPRILVVSDPTSTLESLPFGPFDPVRHRTMEMSLRTTVTAARVKDRYNTKPSKSTANPMKVVASLR